ncbi:polysaccharide biosynthesis protein [Synechococcus sp. MIT S9452]|uniref:polysaccharide biosynthesis protein n=1 Tax=Synechococcus sp. MIT S9452 TaxID=3082546 RepID=UPI0039A4B866
MAVRFFPQLPEVFRYLRQVFSADRHLLVRRLVLLFTDTVVLVFSFWASFALRLSEPWPPALVSSIPLLAPFLILGISILLVTGWYRSLTRSIGSHSFYTLIPRTALIVLLLFFTTNLFTFTDPPRSFWLLLWGVLTVGLLLSRVIARDLLHYRAHLFTVTGRKVPTIVFGAGAAGTRLIQELRNHPDFHLVAVFDDSSSLWNRKIQGLPICNPDAIFDIKSKFRVSQVLLAIPSAPLSRRRQLVSDLGGLGLRVLSIPSIADIASGRHRVSELKTVSIEDVLGREPSTPLNHLLVPLAHNRNFLITGAGGSIGSELSRQVVSLGANTLVLVDHSEFALYKISQELSLLNCSTHIVSSLCDVKDQANLELLCQKYTVNVLLHAAAYKHVPLVESNICSAVENNINATISALQAARNCNLSHFTLISTDKAVRPTNVMGASKRVCELLVQDAANEIRPSKTGPVCSMVRFGNVLNSSGSVIPLFRQQIASGGPVTVTHPQVTRYFMTIPEAVQLVLQATSLSAGGEVFVLDMGDPVLIYDLARQMIQLSGFSLKDSSNPSGDISIEFTGLRPGEKLYEELIIDSTVEKTEHHLIFKARENTVPSDLLFSSLSRLQSSFISKSTTQILHELNLLVPEFHQIGF